VDVLELVLGVTRTPAMERAGLNFEIPGFIVNNSGPDRAKIVLDSYIAIQRLTGARP
jgi:hypothetical protein